MTRLLRRLRTRLRGRPGTPARRKAATLAVAGLALGGLVVPASAAPARPHVRSVIQYTEYGVPHITASNFEDLGYGYGYAAARDNLCVLAETYLTVDAQRSRYLGADAPAGRGLGVARDSLTSDLYFQRVKDSGVVERLARQAPPTGPRPEVTRLVRGYADGYNRYLRETGVDRIGDPACRGKAWVRPITELDVFRHLHATSTVAGSGLMMDGIVGARPPASTTAPRSAADRDAAARIAAAVRGSNGGTGLGSNAIGVGAEGTTSSRSVLLGNPHFHWQGPLRFWQSHLTVPGRMNVSGAGLLGLPMVLIGHNEDVAWSHTISTAATFGLYEVPLVPGSPTTYLVDGEPEAMTAHPVSVAVRRDDGTIGTVRRTLWSTRYGPVVGSGPGGTPLPWGATAYALRDANATNLRALNTWLDMARAESTDDVAEAAARAQGLPWVNTVATDRRGRALYADIQVVPHVTDELAARCSTPLGSHLFALSGVSVLDGGRGECAWGTDRDAVEPGLFGPGRMPRLSRADYVLNANDSPWLTNPRAPLTDYPRGLGDVGTPRTARTQEALVSVQRRLAGTDGLPGRGFSGATMRRTLFDDHSRVAELAAADTAAMCAELSADGAPSGTGPVDVSRGCAALAAWDGRYDLDSRGSLLFARFAQRLARIPGGPWRTPFDPRDPVRTPNTLAVERPEVRQAFGDAAAELTAAGIPLDAPLADHQTVTRNDRRIPVHGAPHELGVLNVLSPVWDPARGNTEVVEGSSFIQVVEFPARGAPRTSTLLTYSQSSDPTSPHHADQTRLFSQGTWVSERFTERDILASPSLRTRILR
ncbi:penicillin acylase family protein [Streptomyces capparidis]